MSLAALTDKEALIGLILKLRCFQDDQLLREYSHLRRNKPLTPDAIRDYVSKLVELGVLVHEKGRYRMRKQRF